MLHCWKSLACEVTWEDLSGIRMIAAMMRSEIQKQGLHNNTKEHSRDHLTASEAFKRELEGSIWRVERGPKVQKD